MQWNKETDRMILQWGKLTAAQIARRVGASRQAVIARFRELADESELPGELRRKVMERKQKERTNRLESLGDSDKLVP